MLDLEAAQKDIEQLEDYDWPEWGTKAITKAYQAGEALIARVRELERGEQHHANIIDRLHSRIDELDNLYRKAMRGDLS